MIRITPFAEQADEYDAWFEANHGIYHVELDAVSYKHTRLRKGDRHESRHHPLSVDRGYVPRQH